MILMLVNTHDYENDVRVMIGAFYPGEKLVTDAQAENECMLCVRVHAASDEVDVNVKKGDKSYSAKFSTEGEDRKKIRDRIKRELYFIFEKITKKSLPWGTLTGIRPVKIPSLMLEQGFGDDRIITLLQEEYLLKPHKARLSLEVAHNEKKLLDSIDYKNGYSLYIGIPFCPTTCLYCSFTSYPIGLWKKRVDEYVEALLKELSYLSVLLKDKRPDTIYIGGGTPTTLEPRQLERLLGFVEDNFNLGGLLEYTVEAGRPDSITREKLDVLRAHGVDRISVNPQTMNQKTLDLIGRRHTVEQIYSAMETAGACGFDNINMDLIVGLPGETKDDVFHTLSEIKKLSPDSLTIHSLAVKRAARLNIEKELYESYRMENTDEIMDMTGDFARELGMQPYYLYRQKNMKGNFENVGYSRPGKAGIYNILIMEEKQSIYAAGANSQSKIVSHDPVRVDRIENVKDVATYIERTDEMIDRKRQFFND